MDVREALTSRRSIREFKPDPVPRDVLLACLEDARWAPSWSNTQPYRVGIAEGAARQRIASALTAGFNAGLPLQRAPAWRKLLAVLRGEVPRGDLDVPHEYPEDLQAARRATGFGLYEALGIKREDRAARDAQMRKNFSFFGAPTAVFLFVHEGLKSYAMLDAGLFLQSFLLACHARGLGTCAQGAVAPWPSSIRAEFDVPPRYKLAVGVSVGWPADAAVNRFNPGRQPVEALLLASR
jgi:nitroreductase